MEILESTMLFVGDTAELALLRNEILCLASSEPGTLTDEQAENLVACAFGEIRGQFA
ncbi:MAG: hypothetical protein KJO38_03590 [Gammaproteobacteria bacterium]|nr:hypothetical protein [Gammaproteobacteria bacterium]